jgi:hypothetical protein
LDLSGGRGGGDDVNRDGSNINCGGANDVGNTYLVYYVSPFNNFICSMI